MCFLSQILKKLACAQADTPRKYRIQQYIPGLSGKKERLMLIDIAAIKLFTTD